MLVAFGCLEQHHVLWHTVALVLPPAHLQGCEAWRCLEVGTPPRHTLPEVNSEGGEPPTPQFSASHFQHRLVFMLFGLSTPDMGAQFSGGPLLRHWGVLLPLTGSANKKLNTACIRAGT